MKVISTTRAICVLIVDILDTSGSFLGRIRNLIGGNPIIVVATKVDLLPKGTNSNHVREWLQDFVAFKRLNCLSVHLLSNKTGVLHPPPLHVLSSALQHR
jgi:nitric-oxide synthase, plant